MKRVGLFIGVNLYSNGISRLEFAKNDAMKLSDCFLSKGYQVERLLNDEVTYDGILNMLERIRNSLAAGDLFVLYFAGHGMEIGGRPYLLCADADDRMETQRGKMPLQDLITYSEKSGIHRLFILDSCRREILSGDRGDAYVCGDSRDPALKRIINECPSCPPLILTSCSRGEKAYEYAEQRRGLFTWVLEKVLNDKKQPVCDFH